MKKRVNFLRKYTVFTRAGLLEQLSWRVGIISTFIGNIIYLIVIYYLWSAIFNASPTEEVKGMTFTDTMLYLVLASAMFSLLEMYIVWHMGEDIRTGKIVLDLLKPIDYQAYLLWNQTGAVFGTFVTTFVPTFIIVDIVTKGAIHIGANVLIFLLSIIFSAMINFFVEFFVGTICMYTQSTWGINIIKVTIVSLFSGATIPIAFFPEVLKTIAMCMPFQAIYNVPLNILLHDEMSALSVAKYLGIQLFWIVVLFFITRLFWKKAQKVITVNGG